MLHRVSWLHAAVLTLGELTGVPDAVPITGGTPVGACGWPSAVWAGGCSGTLVDPEIVVLAAHCAAPAEIVIGEVRTDPAARTIAVSECRRYDAGPLGPGEGTDFQWCRLAVPQHDVSIVPPLLGCETSILQPGQLVTIVGFGVTPQGTLGIKHEVETEIVAIVGNEAQIGGNGADSCQGDSGGPVFVHLPDDAGWRVLGITSYGSADCMSGGFYSLMHAGMPWLEASTGLDLSPCHDAAGSWDPGPRCTGAPLAPGVGTMDDAGRCVAGSATGPLATCGDAFDDPPDVIPPLVAIVDPETDLVLTSDPMTGTARVDVLVQASDEGWGLDRVELRIAGVVLENMTRRVPPYAFGFEMPPGELELRAHAFDLAGNVAQSDPLLVQVDLEEDDDETGLRSLGCGCTTREVPTHLRALILLTLIRRRRTRPNARALVDHAAASSVS